MLSIIDDQGKILDLHLNFYKSLLSIDSFVVSIPGFLIKHGQKKIKAAPPQANGHTVQY
jgi:hypothetical protein